MNKSSSIVVEKPKDPKLVKFETAIQLAKLCPVKEELHCDIIHGPNHPTCEQLFIQNEDCFQRNLCASQWKEALECLKQKPQESCMHLIKKTRRCKETWFDSFVPTSLENYMKIVGGAMSKCESYLARFHNCTEILNPFDPECLEREYQYNSCFYSQQIPKAVWRSYKDCELKNPSNISVACTDELEEVRSLLHNRAEMVRRTLRIPRTTAEIHGGSMGIMDVLSSVIYGSHYKRIFKDYDPRDVKELKDRGIDPSTGTTITNTTTTSPITDSSLKDKK